MASTCLPGLQGFPIQVTQWVSEPNKSKYITQNDILLQFAPTRVPLTNTNGTFALQGNHTFFLGGTQYNVRALRLAKKKQDGLSFRSDDTIKAELQIWGVPSVQSNQQNSLGVLIVPVFFTPISTTAGTVFVQLLNKEPVALSGLFPQGKDALGQQADVVRYTTCIETDKSYSLNISVAYWVYGLGVAQNALPKTGLGTLGEAGIPQFSDYKVLSSYTLTEQGKGNRRYDVNSGILQPYAGSLALQAAPPETQNAFRYISDFLNPTTEKQRQLENMKCIKIDRTRDIKNGKLLIDPETGQRLQDVVNEAEQEDKPEQTISPRDILTVVAIICGVILGCFVLGLVLYAIYYFILTRKSLGVPPEPENVKALVSAMNGQA